MSAAVAPNTSDNLDAGSSSVSRHGRVRKKNSLLAEYDSLDSLDKPRKKYEKDKTPRKAPGTPKVTLKIGGGDEATPKRPMKRGPKAKKMKLNSGPQNFQPDRDYLDDDDGELEIDLPAEYQSSLPLLGAEEIIDEGLLDEEDGATEVAENTSINRLKSQAESTYFLEKSLEKHRKLGPGPAGQPGRIKQVRKDKGSSRLTAYMLWSKEQREMFEKKNMSADVPQMSKKLSDLWATVPANQKKMWKNKAAKMMKKKANLGENMKNSGRGLLVSKPVERVGPQVKKATPPAMKESTVNLKTQKPSPAKQPNTALPTPSPKVGKAAPNKTLSVKGKSAPSAGPASAGSATTTKVTGKGRPSAGITPGRNKSYFSPIDTSTPNNNGVQNSTKKGGSHRFLSNNLSNGPTTKFSGALAQTKAAAQYSPRKEEEPAMYKVTGTAPLDVAAHFSLLGESLSIIGERLKEHEGQTVSGSLSVLLDSLLCACGPLLCLTQQVPELRAVPQEKLTRILDNIAYIMPGL